MLSFILQVKEMQNKKEIAILLLSITNRSNTTKNDDKIYKSWFSVIVKTTKNSDAKITAQIMINT